MTTPDVLVAGETLVDFHPDRRGPIASVGSYVPRPGGAPANVAVGLSRLGRAPWFWTRVGDDPFGAFLVETLEEYGIPDRFVERDPVNHTTLAFVVRDADGDPSFVFYRDGTADTRLEVETIGDGVLAVVDWVIVGGVALSSDPSRTAIVDLVDRARSLDCSVVFDPNARPELWTQASFRTATADVIERADVVKATPGDLAAAGFDHDEPSTLARALLDRGPHTVFVTIGAEGAIAVATDDAPWGPAEVAHSGYEVDAVDPTGAGDAFVAGAVASLADGAPLDRTLAVANAVAALATTAEGSMAALPDRVAVEGLLD